MEVRALRLPPTTQLCRDINLPCINGRSSSSGGGTTSQHAELIAIRSSDARRRITMSTSARCAGQLVAFCVGITAL